MHDWFGHVLEWAISPPDRSGGAPAMPLLLRRRATVRHAIAVVALAALSAAGASVQAVTLTDLGTLGGSYSQAYAANTSGQAVGWSYTTGNSAQHAFLYSSSTMQDLGTLGGSSSQAFGINDSGQVAGYAFLTGDSAYHAFLYSSSTMQDLGTLGGTYSQARGVNASGEVVGWSYTTADNEQHAFLYSSSTMQDLGTLGGTYSQAFGINDSGQVVGESNTTGDSETHAFLYSSSTMQDLGTLGGSYSQARGINTSGQIVGWAYTTGDSAYHAFLYSNGTMQDLGTLGGTYSQALGINDSGQVVGWSYTTGNSAQHAFLYSNGTMQDLGTLGGTHSRAFGISGSGRIVGYAYTSGNANYHAFLFDTSDSTAPSTATSLSQTPNADGWNSADVTVTLTATDDTGGSGVKEITYSATGAQTIGSTTVSGSSTTIDITTEGQTTITFAAKDNDGNTESAQTLTIKLDKTDPTCTHGAPNLGPPATLDVTVQDTGSGIAAIQILTSDALSVSVPSFTPGTTDPLIVTATRTDPLQPALLRIQITDTAGRVTVGDPVITTLAITHDRRASQVFTGLSAAEHKLTVRNSRPGLTGLRVTVNGQSFPVLALKEGESRTLDVGAAMRPGSNNTITLTGWGPPNGSALVMISD